MKQPSFEIKIEEQPSEHISEPLTQTSTRGQKCSLNLTWHNIESLNRKMLRCSRK